MKITANLQGAEWELKFNGIVYDRFPTFEELSEELTKISRDYAKGVEAAGKAIIEANRWLNECQSDQREFNEALPVFHAVYNNFSQPG